MLKERLHQKRKELKLSREALAEMAGVSTSTITFLENGRNESSKHLVEIASALGVTAEWLKDGGELQASNEVTNVASTPLEDAIGMEPWDDNTPLLPTEVEVPFFEDIHLSAGSGCFFDDNNIPAKKLRFSKHMLASKKIDYKNVVCVTAKGESMEPVIPDGSTIAIDTGDKDIKDGQVYAINNDGLLQIKMLKWQSGTKLIIESYNPTYESEPVSVGDIEILGRMFWYSVLL